MNYELDDQLQAASSLVIGNEDAFAGLLEKYVPLARSGDFGAACAGGRIFTQYLRWWLKLHQLDLWVGEAGIPDNEEEDPDADLRED